MQLKIHVLYFILSLMLIMIRIVIFKNESIFAVSMSSCSVLTIAFNALHSPSLSCIPYKLATVIDVSINTILV